MSFKAFVWAWQQDVPNADYHHVLLALANIAPVREVKASVPYIAKEVRRSQRKVRAAIDWLEEAGVITITVRPGMVDVIRLEIPKDFLVHMDDDEGDLEMGVRGRPKKTPAPSEISEKTPAKPLSNPSPPGADEPLEPSEPISSLRSESSDDGASDLRFADLGGDGYGDEPEAVEEAIDAEFEDAGPAAAPGTDLTVVVPDDDRPPFEVFWQAYPRRTAKGSAREAFAKAVKKRRVAESWLIARARDYAAAVSHWPEDARRRFVPHAATWLNQGRWEDDMNEVRLQHRHDGGRPTMTDVLAAGEILNGYDDDPRF